MILEDISALTRPQTAVATIKRAKQYVAHMQAANKPVDHVALNPSEYDAILRSVNAYLAKRPDPIKADGLRIGNVRVTRGST